MVIELGSDASGLTARRRIGEASECDWGSKGKARRRHGPDGKRYIEGT
jgi:hypothetical protein